MNTINDILKKNKCCGCGLCSLICPKKAIEMVEDENGFKYPNIDEKKCVKCGLCVKKCSYNNINYKEEIKISLAGISKNHELLMKSSSGGVFSSLAINFIKNNGIVYGCSIEKDDTNKLEPKHIRVTTLDELVKLQGSKYVQSNLQNIFLEVKTDLESGENVLFSGTPCQIAALNSFLNNKSFDNLITIDIICHGVPNVRMFKDFITFIEKRKNIKIDDFSFRDKSKGTGYFSKILYLKNGLKKEKVIPAIELSYFQLFLDSLNIRENCYSCPYAGNKRVSDITIGDYWGIEKEHLADLQANSLKSKNGVSCVIINSLKGEKIIEKFSDNIIKINSSYERISKYNHQLNRPSKYSIKRESLFEAYKINGYNGVEKWYRKYKGISYFIKKIWYKIPYDLRKKIK